MARTEAEQAADEAIGRVRTQISDDEKESALLEIALVCDERPDFTTDDVPLKFLGNVDRRVLGFIMREAAKEGFCEPVMEWRKSEQVQCHARPKRVWKSLVFRSSE